MTRKNILAAIALAGLFVSGYLWIGYVTPIPLVCDGSGGCEIIRLSEYASFFGIPTPLYGIVFYGALGVLVAIERYSTVRWLTVAGVAVSIYLTYISSFIIQAWCVWCIASGLLAFAAFIVAWWPERPRQPDVIGPISEAEPA